MKLWAHTVLEPEPMRAGFLGEEPFYFECACCTKPGVPIAGYVCTGAPPAYENIVLVNDDDEPYQPGWRLALFCASCWPPVLAELQVDGTGPETAVKAVRTRHNTNEKVVD